MSGYEAWHTNRGGSDKGGGGLTLLYRDTLTAHRYSPSVPANLEYIQNERQWLLITSGSDHVAFLHTYIACQGKDDSFLSWNEDLFFLLTQEAKCLKQQGFTILAMGDFNSRVGTIAGLEGNTPDHNQNTPLFFNFLNEINLLIINTLPVAKGLFTRFIDSSGRPGSRSLLDYGLIDHEKADTVTSFVIDADARVECGSDHALLKCTITFSYRPKMSWSFHESVHYNFQGADFTAYQKCLDRNLTTSLTRFSKQSTTEMLGVITEAIDLSAKETFGLKVKKKKRGRKLPKEVLSLIKRKNLLSRDLVHASFQRTQQEKLLLRKEIDCLKLQIKEKVSVIKLHRRARIRSKLLLGDPTRKKFWRFLKGQMKAAGSISALTNKSGKMVFDQEDIEETVLDHFATVFEGQRVPVHPVDPAGDQVEKALEEIEAILGESEASFAPDHFEEEICRPYSSVELEQILQKLPSGKASGYDRLGYKVANKNIFMLNRIPNELLKNSSTKFQQYLLEFLNKILDEGVVPEALNTGKCILVYKVRVIVKGIFTENKMVIFIHRVGILLNHHSTARLLFHQICSALSLSGCAT